MTDNDTAMADQPAFIIDQWDFGTTPARQLRKLTDGLANRWIHCQRDQAGLDEWMDRMGIHAGLRQAVLAEDTRPRFEVVPGGFLLILRGVNLNPGAEPDDMLSLRVLWYKDGLITLRKWPFRAISAVRDTLKDETGPATLGALLVTIIEAINLRIDELLEAQEAELEELEAIDHISNPQQHLTRLTQLHRRLLRLDRFIRPQVGALERMAIDADAWLGGRELQLLSNQRDTTMRILETIEMLLQQIQLVRDELQQDLAERMNRNTYWLSVIAGIFLPLGLLTGLLGINVGGMPGVDDPRAFWLTCAVLAVVAVVEFLLLRRLRFFGK